MTPSAARGRDDERNLEWIHIDDFTPGVYDNSYISLAEPKLSAPLGAADAVNTFCCGSLAAQLGLGPLPALTTTFTYSPAFPGTATKLFVVGFIINPGLRQRRRRGGHCPRGRRRNEPLRHRLLDRPPIRDDERDRGPDHHQRNGGRDLRGALPRLHPPQCHRHGVPATTTTQDRVPDRGDHRHSGRGRAPVGLPEGRHAD